MTLRRTTTPAGYGDARTIGGVRANALAAALTLAVAGAVPAALRAPVRVTLDSAAGVRPGMSAATVSARWGIDLRPSYEVRPNCGEAELRGLAGIDGYAVFMPHGRFGAVFFRQGAVTGRGIRIGSTLAEVLRAYRSLTMRPNRFLHGEREYFARRRAAPHWELRIDVDAGKHVTRIVFGTHAAVRLDEACA
jgi:hypothetical protein